MNIWDSAKEKILVVAHRGAAGGNIPCHTLGSYEPALKQGTEMIEIDVEMSRDGKLFIFHPGMEPHHLGISEYICNMKAEEIEKLRYVNYDRTPTQFPINTFDELLETFKGRCFINVDKFWGHPKEIYETIKRHNMADQIVVKSSPSDKVFEVLEGLAPELAYMPIVRDTHPLHEKLLASKINYIGAEVLFTSEDAEVASPAFFDKMHKNGCLVWGNAIIYNYKEQLSAGHSDDTALSQSMDLGWGWLAERGFDLIQTDWTGMMVQYLKEKGLLYRS